MDLKEALGKIYQKAKKEFNIENTPTLYLRQDDENAREILGKTAYYSPSDMSIVLYITNRHPKDICRSFAHELVHHHQNERGDLDIEDRLSPTYAQDNEHMREMEKEAYLKGNLLFRDWEDWYKSYRNSNRG
tara:strand:- start:4043 stop:4438 length:396 start_codon:yes stop_codon:yes gene_type:complete